MIRFSVFSWKQTPRCIVARDVLTLVLFLDEAPPRRCQQDWAEGQTELGHICNTRPLPFTQPVPNEGKGVGLPRARINQGKDQSTGDSSGVRFKCKALLSSVSNFWGSKCLCSNRGLGEALLIPPPQHLLQLGFMRTSLDVLLRTC